MEKPDHSNFILADLTPLFITRPQNGFMPFIEKPSDKYDVVKGGCVPEKINSRINAVELFSLFTADIIKKEVVFFK